MKIDNILKKGDIDFLVTAIEAQKSLYREYPEYPYSPRDAHDEVSQSEASRVVESIDEYACANSDLKAINLILKIKKGKFKNIKLHSTKSTDINFVQSANPKKINAFVLCWDSGLHSYAYLEALYRRNYIPSEIIVVRRDSNAETQARPSLIRKVARKIKGVYNKRKNTRKERQSELRKRLTPLEYKDINLEDKPDYKKYCNKVTSISAKSINDKAVIRSVKKAKSDIGVFTGGGILKKQFFDLDKKYIHVHPGVLPDIRGADCLLWSILLRGRPGMTCFFMNKYIDQGEILLSKEYETPRLDLSDFESKEIYTALLKSYDIWLRADCLVSLCEESDGLAKLHPKSQDPEEGRQYHFMEQSFRDDFISSIFK